MNTPSYRSHATGAVISNIHLEPNLIAKVFRLDDSCYQGALLRRSLVVPEDCALYFIDKYGQVMEETKGTASVGMIDRLLHLNQGSALLVRTIPVTLNVHIEVKGSYQADLEATDGFTIDAVMTASVHNPLTFCRAMGLTSLSSALTCAAVETLLANALLQGIARQGRKVLFKTREAIQNALRALPDIGLAFSSFSVTRYTSDVNNRLIAMRDENDSFRQDARRMLLKQLDNYATSTQKLLEAAVANNAPPEVIDSVMNRYAQIIETLSERIEHAGLPASPRQQAALRGTAAPRLTAASSQNANTAGSNIRMLRRSTPQAQAANGSRFGR